MKRSTAGWSTALAAAALLALPVSGLAQTPGSQQPVPQQPTTTETPTTQQPSSRAERDDQGSAQEHIRKAEAALDEIPSSSLTGESKSQVAELKRHINAMQRTAAANDKASGTGAASRSGQAAEPRGNANWSTEIAAADRILTQLLGTPSMSGTGEATGTTGTTGATGTTGSTKSAPSSSMLDDTTRAKLLEVRAHLSAFAAAMGDSSSPSASPSSSSTSSTSASSAPPSAAAESSEAQSQASPPSTPGTAGTTGMQPPATSGADQPATAQAGGQGQVDEEAAKRHLTAARNSLSELTQLPAASQLTGDARTQVSQLISNFNGLITTDSEWRASYDKVSANVTALIGSQTADESQTAAASTPGAVGTSGTAGGGLDPAIRQKLVEFRTHLRQFEQAAGGASSGTSTPGEAAARSTANPRSTTDPSSTANPTGSAYPSSPSTSTPGTTPEQSAGAAQGSTQHGSAHTATQQPSEEQGHSEAMRHIAAIEAILSGQPGASSPSSSPSTSSPTGTTGATGAGPATLDRAQIEQIRTHLTELRKLLQQARQQ